MGPTSPTCLGVSGGTDGFDASWAAGLTSSDLPVLPDVTERVLRMAGDPKSSLSALADVLSKDAAMSAHVLRLANSPLYRGREPIVSLHQAAARLGTQKLRDVAVVVASESRLFRARGFEAEARHAFQHGLVCGLWAQEIARRLRGPVEEAFLCGLLHDVGIPVLLQSACDRLPNALELRAEVLQVVDALHAGIGADLVRAWKLPAHLATAIGQHHGQTDSVLAAIVVLADDLADFTENDVDDDAIVERVLAHDASAALNLYDDDVTGIVKLRDAITGTCASMAGAA